jgi:Na+/melibiose symporter-like transporter
VAKVFRHVFLPLLASMAMIGLYFTPVAIFGCVNRGLIALALAVGALVVGIVLALIAIRRRESDRSESAWLALSAALLALPALLLIGPLG